MSDPATSLEQSLVFKEQNVIGHYIGSELLIISSMLSIMIGDYLYWRTFGRKGFIVKVVRHGWGNWIAVNCYSIVWGTIKLFLQILHVFEHEIQAAIPYCPRFSVVVTNEISKLFLLIIISAPEYKA